MFKRGAATEGGSIDRVCRDSRSYAASVVIIKNSEGVVQLKVRHHLVVAQCWCAKEWVVQKTGGVHQMMSLANFKPVLELWRKNTLLSIFNIEQ